MHVVGSGKPDEMSTMNEPEPIRDFSEAEVSGPHLCSRRERSLLVPYALTGCRPDEGALFEAHMLQCEACFKDLKLLDRAAALIGDWSAARVALADLFYNAPPSEGPNDRLRSFLDSIPTHETSKPDALIQDTPFRKAEGQG